MHKKKLAVVVADVEVHDEYQFERRWFGSNPEQLQQLAEWLIEQRVEEVVMESTAQYWQGVWGALERYWRPTCQNGKALARCRESCISRKRYPIVGGEDGRGIFQMPSDW